MACTQGIGDASDIARTSGGSEARAKHLHFLSLVQQARAERLGLQDDGIATGIAGIDGSQFAVTRGLQKDVAHPLDVNGGIGNGLAHRINGGHLFRFTDQVGQPGVLDGHRIRQRGDRKLVPLARSAGRQRAAVQVDLGDCAGKRRLNADAEGLG